MDEIKELLEQFKYYANNPRKQLDKYLAEGKKAVGVFPYYAPEEIVYAAGIVPFGVWGGQGSIERAKAYFPTFYYSLALRCLEMALDGTLDGLSASIITTLDDTLRPFSQNYKVGVGQKIPMIFLNHGQHRKEEFGKTYNARIFNKAKEESDNEELGYIDPCKHLSLEEAKQRIANGEKYVVRQTIPSTGITSFEDEVYGHIEVENAGLAEGVLLKSDGYPTYNFANIVDDHLMNITHVVRGNEYLSSTPKYNLIYQAFGWDVPSYIHCPPVMKDEKHKLSKRNGDASYQDLINKGFLNEAILNYIALLGWSPEGEQEIFSLDELIEAFDVKRISKSGAIFDMNKLKWINSQYIKKLDTKQLTELCLPFLKEAYDLSNKSEAWIEKLVEVHRDHISCGEEIVEQVKLFFEDEIHLEEEAIEFMKDEAIPNTLAVFKSKVAELAEEDFKQDQIFACIKATQKEAKARGKMLYMPLRIATTGIMHGPDLAASMELLGKEKVLKRLG